MEWFISSQKKDIKRTSLNILDGQANNVARLPVLQPDYPVVSAVVGTSSSCDMTN